MLAAMIDRLTASGVAARAAIADTVGAAHALARYAARPIRIVPAGGSGEAGAPLPLSALRLAPALVVELHRFGLSASPI
jgi:protein ImuB